MANPAFLTGSRAYGEVGEDSDFDLVVLTSSFVVNEMRASGMAHGSIESGPSHSVSVKQGKLNLILTCDPERYRSWRLGTMDLMLKREGSGPVSREEAVAHFQSIFQEEAFGAGRTGL